MTTEIDIVREKEPFLTSTSFLKKGKFKLLQTKQDNIRQKTAKNMKGEKVSPFDTLGATLSLPLYTAVRILGDSHFPTLAYLLS